MNAKNIHDMLVKLAQNTYPERDIGKFYVEMQNKEVSSKHGDYEFIKEGFGKIRVFNMSR
jgi:hypothetical protein